MTLSPPLNPAEQAHQRLHALVDAWLGQQDDREAVQAHRLSALAQFAAFALPTPRHEDWKYTRLAGLWKLPLTWAPAASAVVLPTLALPVQAIQLVFVNGHFSTEHSSDLSQLPQGLSIDVHMQHCPTTAHVMKDDPFSALATAGVSAMACIQVANGVAIEAPIVLHAMGTQGVAQSIDCRVQIGECASLTVLEVASGADQGVMFNHVSIDVAQNGQCTHLLWHNLADTAYAFGWRSVNLARDARLMQRSLLASGLLSRQQLSVTMMGENAESDVASGVVALAKQTQDVRTHTRHACFNARSRQLHRFALGGQANGVFHGDIVVEKGADKTDANMATNNLLLSPTAQANSKPQLEIYADDVRCTHGVTCGSVDETQIFYLRARGIPEATARLMVSAAFAQAAVADVPLPEVAAAWQQIISDKLHEALVA